MEVFSSSPFRLKERLREQLDSRIDAVPLFNVLLIAVLLTLTGSRFIFAPGVPLVLNGTASSVAAVPLKNAPDSAAEMRLPYAGTMLRGEETTSVLTVKSDSMFIFDGHIYDDLAEVFAAKISSAAEPRGVLLVKLDRAVSVQGLFRIAELAGEAGFSSLQIAGESPSFAPQEKR